MTTLLLMLSICWGAEKTYSLDDVRSEGCRAVCVKLGYTSGRSKGSTCYCIQAYDYEDFIHNRVNIRDLNKMSYDSDEIKIKIE